MTRGADLDPYDFSTLQSYISNLRFKSAPGPGSGGFILATLDVPQGNEVVQSSHSERDKENAEPGKPGFKVEDYHDNHKWENLVNILKDKQGPVFVVLDLTWTRIEGGNKRGLVLIEWQQRDNSYIVARSICRKFAIMNQWLAKTEEDLNLNKIKDYVSKGAAMGTK